jgi:ribonuclease BN (tRNA processing enzyme)
MDSDYFPVELGDMSPHIEVHEVRRSVKVGRLTVLPFYLNHPSMCLAYRVTDGKRSIVYATDNEPYTGTLHRKPSKTSKPTDLPTYLDEKFVQFLSNADLYIGEGQYTTDEYKEKRGWGHSPIESTIQFAVQANVKRLVLFHHDPLHDDAFVDRMVREAKQLIAFYGGKIDCVGAQEGMEIVIP